jgi:hypothetical protein
VDPDALRTFARMLMKVAKEIGARGTGARTACFASRWAYRWKATCVKGSGAPVGLEPTLP